MAVMRQVVYRACAKPVNPSLPRRAEDGPGIETTRPLRDGPF